MTPSKRPSWPFVGQDYFGQRIQECIATGAWPSAALWAGPAHLGKRSAVCWAIQASLCPSNERPCGTCSSCRRVEQLSHPDVVWIEAEPGAEISIESIRAAHERLHTIRTAHDPLWFVIIDADRLSESASQSLLKTTEEPPSHVRLILTTAFPSRLRPTLRSRLAMYRWKVVPAAAIDRLLNRDFPDLRPADRRAIIARSAGRPGLAMTWARDMERFAQSGDAVRALRLADVSSGGLDAAPDGIQPTALHAWRDVILEKLGAREHLRFPDRQDDLRALAAAYSWAKIRAISHRLVAWEHYRQHHVTNKLLSHDLDLVL